MKHIVKCILIIAFASIYPTKMSAFSNSDVERCMQFIYKYMPLPDSTDRSREFYEEYAVKPALRAKDEMPWGKIVPEREFYHFVLPLRVNNEALDRHRPQFYEELKPRIEGMSMKEAILEINHWCHEKVTYQPSDGRTHSPLQSVSSAIGRCGEESTFTVAALRTMGIPARQVYTPRWAHTDDNHAWVEAWADGEWHFLGACEPEPVLDLGWFNAPAARGMLMHARVFGDYNGEEEMLDRQGGTTFINVTSNYAPVDTLAVKIIDVNGFPAKNIDVTYRLYNYAEFYPIATKKTDSEGKSSIVCGLGDLLVWASDGVNFGLAKGSVGKDRQLIITLDHNSSTPIDMALDIVPPPVRPADVKVTPEQQAENARRLSVEDSIRNAYTATFIESTPILKKSRGNHHVISGFIESQPENKRVKAIKLLEYLSEKDLTDVTADVLADHITADGDTGDIFAAYVMSPRIEVEELTAFRSPLLKAIGKKRANEMRSNPQLWVKWVKDNIDASQTWYPEQITMSPMAVWKHRSTSSKSRDIFFVAGARAMGIPARIEPVTGKAQWLHGERWINAAFDNGDSSTHNTRYGSVTLVYEPSEHIADPKYYAHFTLSKIVDGQPQLLNFDDFAPWSEILKTPYTLEAGTYLLVTGQRMADGSVLTRMKSIAVNAGENTTDTLAIRNDNTGIQVLGSFNSENTYVPLGESTPRSLLSTTGRGYYILGLIRPNHEPSNHALRDIAMLSDELNKLGRKMILLYGDSSDAARADTELINALPEIATVGTDIDSKITNEIAGDDNISSGDYPVFIIADTFNRVVFITKGYTIGLGQTLTNILNRLEQ